MQTMELPAAHDIAIDLLQKHLPKNRLWKLAYHNAITTWGWCDYSKCTISLSRPLILYNTEKILREVVLHEIAHAWVTVGKDHGKEWRAKAIELGSSGERVVYCNIPPKRFVGRCRLCAESFKTNRRYETCPSCLASGASPHRCSIGWRRHSFWQFEVDKAPRWKERTIQPFSREEARLVAASAEANSELAYID